MKQKQDKIKETKYKNGKNNKSAVSGVYTKNKQTNKNAVTEKPGDTSFLSTRTNKKIK